MNSGMGSLSDMHAFALIIVGELELSRRGTTMRRKRPSREISDDFWILVWTKFNMKVYEAIEVGLNMAWKYASELRTNWPQNRLIISFNQTNWSVIILLRCHRHNGLVKRQHSFARKNPWGYADVIDLLVRMDNNLKGKGLFTISRESSSALWNIIKRILSARSHFAFVLFTLVERQWEKREYIKKQISIRSDVAIVLSWIAFALIYIRIEFILCFSYCETRVPLSDTVLLSDSTLADVNAAYEIINRRNYDNSRKKYYTRR